MLEMLQAEKSAECLDDQSGESIKLTVIIEKDLQMKYAARYR